MNRHYVIPVREVEQVLRPSYTECVSQAVTATGRRRQVLAMVLERRMAEARKL